MLEEKANVSGEGRYRERKQMSREKENIVKEGKFLGRKKIS
jgi:hypothetical protein